MRRLDAPSGALSETVPVVCQDDREHAQHPVQPVDRGQADETLEPHRPDTEQHRGQPPGVGDQPEGDEELQLIRFSRHGVVETTSGTGKRIVTHQNSSCRNVLTGCPGRAGDWHRQAPQVRR